MPSGTSDIVRAEARACDQGDMLACTNLGTFYEAGEEVARDLERALTLYQRACEGHASIACSNAANVLRDRGEGAAALPLLERGCAMQEPGTCFQLGRLLRSDDAGAPDPERAYALIRDACRARLLAACVEQAEQLRDGEGVARDSAAAYALLNATCERNSVLACVAEGAMALDPHGPAYDRERGARLMLRACASDDAEACWTFAQLLGDGPAAENTPEDASVYAERACVLGLSAACPEAPAN